MLVLSIAHNLFITEQDAMRLYQGEDIEIVGHCLPVWYLAGNTSEPAEEVFCKYILTNNLKNYAIKIEKDGFKINMPQLPVDYKPPVTPDDTAWLKMTEEDRIKWYAAQAEAPPTARNLLPSNLGGFEFLHFKEYNKIKKNDNFTTVIHIVEIKYQKVLFDSMYLPH